jgi:hypothetical protein
MTSSATAIRSLVPSTGAGIDSRGNVLRNLILPKRQRTTLRHFDTDAFAPPRRAEFGLGNALRVLQLLPPRQLPGLVLMPKTIKRAELSASTPPPSTLAKSSPLPGDRYCGRSGEPSRRGSR